MYFAMLTLLTVEIHAKEKLNSDTNDCIYMPLYLCERLTPKYCLKVFFFFKILIIH